MAEIKAKETFYNGFWFRSRLEARWAVFFDALKIRYEYEPERFVVPSWIDGDSSWSYLPDFFLTDLGTWVEVKGYLDDTSDDYLDMIAHAIDYGGALPGVANSVGTSKGLLWLGRIPDERHCDDGPPTHVILQHGKGGWSNYCNFRGGPCFEVTGRWDNYWDASAGAADELRSILSKIVYRECWCLLNNKCSPDVRRAYRDARMARFEWGQSGAPQVNQSPEQPF